MPNCWTLENNNNMKKSADYKSRLNWKEMNSKELFKLRNRKETLS
jgi:hypothetical protein